MVPPCRVAMLMPPPSQAAGRSDCLWSDGSGASIVTRMASELRHRAGLMLPCDYASEAPATRGNRSVNVVPSASVDCTSIVPPCAVTILSTM